MALGSRPGQVAAAAQRMVDVDADHASLAAGLKVGAIASAVAPLLLRSTDDPLVVSALLSNRNGVLSGEDRVLAMSLMEQAEVRAGKGQGKELLALVAAGSADERVADDVVRAIGRLPASERRIVFDRAVKDPSVRGRSLVAAAVATLAPADLADVVQESSRHATAQGTPKHRVWREAVAPAVKWRLAGNRTIGCDSKAEAVLGKVAPLLTAEERTAAARRMRTEREHSEVGRAGMEALLVRRTADDWVPIRGASKAVEALGGEDAVRERWQGAWAEAARLDPKTAAAIRSDHTAKWGTWSSTAQRDRDRVARCVAERSAAEAASAAAA